MSWTIETPAEGDEALLRHAVTKALDADILLFCASNDQGNLSDIPYPARIDQDKIFRIGSATALGNPDAATQKSVMFIAPGSDEVKQTSHSEDMGFARPRFGSSIATARCAGLAALILQCIVLTNGTHSKRDLRKHPNMQSMFARMVEHNYSGGNSKYLRVWEVFEVAKAKAALGADEEGNVIRAVASEFMRMVKWMNVSAGPFG